MTTAVWIIVGAAVLFAVVAPGSKQMDSIPQPGRRVLGWLVAAVILAFLVGGGLPTLGESVGVCTDGASDVRNSASTNCGDMLTRAICGAQGANGGWCDAVFGGVP